MHHSMHKETGFSLFSACHMFTNNINDVNKTLKYIESSTPLNKKSYLHKNQYGD